MAVDTRKSDYLRLIGLVVVVMMVMMMMVVVAVSSGRLRLQRERACEAEDKKEPKQKLLHAALDANI
jgi:hypothetical protein